MDVKKGKLYWITGLSGAGKSVIAAELVKILKSAGSNPIVLDGDHLRDVLSLTHNAHSSMERLKIAQIRSRLCKLITDQGIDLVCPTMSMFHECRKWNRDNIPNYREIYVRVPLEVLMKRDPKKIYARALKGELSHVMGVDIPYEEPKDPDIILDNDGDNDPATLADMIYKHFQV